MKASITLRVDGEQHSLLQEADDRSAPMGSRGIGEIGIVGAAAAIANAGPTNAQSADHAGQTRDRVRRLISPGGRDR